MSGMLSSNCLPGSNLTPCASAAGACGAAARPAAEYTRAAAPRTRPGQQQARVRLSGLAPVRLGGEGHAPARTVQYDTHAGSPAGAKGWPISDSLEKCAEMGRVRLDELHADE